MNTTDILTDLQQQGVHIWVENETLNVRSPKGVLTPDIKAQIVAHKPEIVAFLRGDRNLYQSYSNVQLAQSLSLKTIGRLIGEVDEKFPSDRQQTIIDPKFMAQRLTVTFRPLPKGYKNKEITKFRTELEQQMLSYGVKVQPWKQATKELYYAIKIPFINWTKNIKARVVKTEINAVIDVDRLPSFSSRAKEFLVNKLYQIYFYIFLKYQKTLNSEKARLISCTEECVAKYLEDATNTQVISITDLDREFVNWQTPYYKKMKIGLNTLAKTFSQIAIGVSSSQISIFDINLYDYVFSKYEINNFVSKSLIPKVYSSMLPLQLNKFKIGKSNFQKSNYAKKLVSLNSHLADINLFTSDSKLNEVIRTNSHRDIANSRSGLSYSFFAYAEPPHYIGELEITERDWESLYPIAEFNTNEVRQNSIGRRYLKTQIRGEYKFKQIPDIWILSTRPGSNQTNLSLESDILRIGLTDRLLLQLPQGLDSELVDIKPSYDIYVMLAMSLATALYVPEIIRNGAPIVHFHGYPAFEWFKSNEYCIGVHNSSIPYGSYKSGIFNFLRISSLANQSLRNLNLISLVEPDRGTSFIAHDLEYLVSRLKAGCAEGQIGLGEKHFASLNKKLSDRGVQMSKRELIA
ncbi:hypothetical protein [Dendronalium sp. ChiSLP03b]|uniref:TubC N-terminal docking domain-related protein n=1 Tax=Dendronalium sp. ChiSLP03b TaxID=3075381 RepID=UPI002AD27592|nr:hypothetical protein [Dendronalium sp. ChiSLP03b]MDZ8205234.1 hypothetical protein [Dendronalium sp. ChiSLP03b]